MEVIYINWHNSYNFALGKKYKASFYKKGWLLIEEQLYREEYFEIVQEGITG